MTATFIVLSPVVVFIAICQHLFKYVSSLGSTKESKERAILKTRVIGLINYCWSDGTRNRESMFARINKILGVDVDRELFDELFDKVEKRERKASARAAFISKYIEPTLKYILLFIFLGCLSFVVYLLSLAIYVFAFSGWKGVVAFYDMLAACIVLAIFALFITAFVMFVNICFDAIEPIIKALYKNNCPDIVLENNPTNIVEDNNG